MAPGNAWHFPANADALANYDSMRSPVFPVDPRTPKSVFNAIAIFIGNQYTGGNSAGNLLQTDSFLNWRTTNTPWTSVPLTFDKQVGNNKYFRANIPLANLDLGTQVQYYSSLIYSDQDPTYLGVAEDDPSGRISARFSREDLALARPFIFTIAMQAEQKQFAYSVDRRTERGEWSNVFPLPNVAAHASLLRTGKILIWGRRGIPTRSDEKEQSMNTLRAEKDERSPATCTPFLLHPPVTKDGQTNAKWDMAKAPFISDGLMVNANLPKFGGKTKVDLPKVDGRTNANLFCSGHTFLPNGDLMVAGGHLKDSWGLDQSCIYEIPKPTQGVSSTHSYNQGTNVNVTATVEGDWKAVPAKSDGSVMGSGRWYPTVTVIPSGVPLVASGSDRNGNINDQQIMNNNVFTSLDPDGQIFDLYPRMHVASSGVIYIVSLNDIYYLDLSKSRKWQMLKAGRPLKDYGCSVMYDKDRLIYIGGGNPPSAATDTLDLSDTKTVAWKPADPMIFRRRQHNATVLPDGTIFVTGGTRGDGTGATKFADDVRFNDLQRGRPVHAAELWNPENVTALLLPDGRVLSAGGGEFQLGSGELPDPNDPRDSHRDAQVFSPPYLFLEGPSPVIESISTEPIVCGSKFEIGTAEPGQISKINLIGLSSVTHSINTGQRFVPLKEFVAKGKTLTVTAPPNPKSCIPGYYMLFIVNKRGQPSVAKIVQIVPTAEQEKSNRQFNAQLASKDEKPPTVLMMRKTVRAKAAGTRIELGITPTCPYGLKACWGGAAEALAKLSGVRDVDPVPHMSGSTASVFLEDNGLPDIVSWTKEFKSYVRQTYVLRGFEAVVSGTVEKRDDTIVLLSEGMRPEVRLARLGPESKVQWDPETRRPQILTEEEMAAYDDLFRSASSDSAGQVTITGPLSQTDEFQYTLQVRLIKWETSGSA
ncbi:hypothetical protein FKW77_006127 [Venturia effusa]|uniref:Galactose oxidase-like Early set domain-containing protein n=1 Tax=Venturia effusa TaxID=50376 RepID=A0A517LQE7_9PEZI|nr:hypothetical protein FKW77_006127 [Venturia effusa]